MEHREYAPYLLSMFKLSMLLSMLLNMFERTNLHYFISEMKWSGMLFLNPNAVCAALEFPYLLLFIAAQQN